MRGHFVQGLQQMSSGEREVLNNGVFEIGREHVMSHAKEYASLPPSQRASYVSKALDQFQDMRSRLSGQKLVGPGGGKGNGNGTGSPNNNGGDASNPGGNDLSEPLKKDLPSSSDEMMKMLVDRTSGRERAEAKPFIDAMATQYKERQGKKRR